MKKVFFIFVIAVISLQGCWFFGRGDITPDINSSDPDKRRIAVIEMGQRESGDITKLQKMIFEDEDALVRGQCAIALAKIQGKIAIEIITQMLTQEKSKLARMDACYALGLIADVNSVDILSNILNNDHDSDVRRESAKALGKIHSQNSINALINALEDSNPSVKLVARESLVKLTGVDNGLDKKNWQSYQK